MLPHTNATTKMLGLDIRCDTTPNIIREIADWLSGQVRERQGRWLACINPHSYVQIRARPERIAAYQKADWLVPDGAGIVVASRFGSKSIAERVTGSDIFFGLHDVLEQRGGARVFFLGSTEETLAKIRSQFEADYRNLKIVGTYSPPFKPAFDARDNADMIQAINASKPDILWVGMTAPKQEEWIAANITSLDVRFAGAIGAVFDFYVGNVRRSPEFFRNHHLEWLPRLLQEPRRLWRRTFISAPIFLMDIATEKLGFKGERS